MSWTYLSAELNKSKDKGKSCIDMRGQPSLVQTGSQEGEMGEGNDGRKFSKNVARTDRQNAGMSGTPLWKIRAEAEKKAEEERAAAALFPGEADGPFFTMPGPVGDKPTGAGWEREDALEHGWWVNAAQGLLYNDQRQKYYVHDAGSNGLVLCDPNHTPFSTGLVLGSELLTSPGSPDFDGDGETKTVVVKNLAAAGEALKIPLGHLDKPCALFAVFYGHKATVELCAKGFHTKLLPRMSTFRGAWSNDKVREALVESFEELDVELLARAHEFGVETRASAAVGLVLGTRMVVAATGGVTVAAASTIARVTPTKEDRARCGDKLREDLVELESGAKVPVRTFGCFAAKHQKLAIAEPQVIFLDLNAEGFVLLATDHLPVKAEEVAEAHALGSRPRSIGGHVLEKASAACLGKPHALLAVVGASKEAKSEENTAAPRAGPPLVKKAKVETKATMTLGEKIRCRHILLKHKDVKKPVDDVRRRPVKRTKDLAEKELRAVLMELLRDPAIFPARARAISECATALKGGEMAGDLGWFGRGSSKQPKAFEDAAFALEVNEISDVVLTESGVHIIQRAA
jgi:NIMA-interacting peptidyl-prolyl cis-trans isomerase 1